MFTLPKLTSVQTLGQRSVVHLDSYEIDNHFPRKRRRITVPDGLRMGRENDKGGALYTTSDIKAGEVVFAFQGRVKKIEDATPMGLQIGENLFLEADKYDPYRFDEFTNHSCNPNGYAQFRKGHPYFTAIRNIEAGEELAFNYNTTEWDMWEQEAVMKAPSVFICHCKTVHCLGRIMGFRYLPIEQKLKLRPYLSPYLKGKLEEELATVTGLLLAT
jgi:hypothetical protein